MYMISPHTSRPPRSAQKRCAQSESQRKGRTPAPAAHATASNKAASAHRSPPILYPSIYDDSPENENSTPKNLAPAPSANPTTASPSANPRFLQTTLNASIPIKSTQQLNIGKYGEKYDDLHSSFPSFPSVQNLDLPRPTRYSPNLTVSPLRFLGVAPNRHDRLYKAPITEKGRSTAHTLRYLRSLMFKDSTYHDAPAMARSPKSAPRSPSRPATSPPTAS